MTMLVFLIGVLCIFGAYTALTCRIPNTRLFLLLSLVGINCLVLNVGMILFPS